MSTTTEIQVATSTIQSLTLNDSVLLFMSWLLVFFLFAYLGYITIKKLL